MNTAVCRKLNLMTPHVPFNSIILLAIGFFYKIIMYVNHCFQGREKDQMPLDNNCNNCRTTLLINFVLHSMKNKKTNEGDY